jgi:protoporphyrinogen oxidase
LENLLKKPSPQKIAVIGAGPMGLMCAYELLKKGFDVTLLERDDRIGGMTASFDFDGTLIERFYHFICKTDTPYFDLLKELGLSEKLRWRDTDMGFYYDGKLYPWGSPINLLKFPKISWITKFRYALFAYCTTQVKDFKSLDKVGVTPWLIKWLGKKGYEQLWLPLFYYKFYQYKDDLSAAWLGTRIRRVGKSRRSIFQEEMGYLEGGSEVLLKALEKKILELGGKITLNTDIQEVITENMGTENIKSPGKKKVTGVRVNNLGKSETPSQILPFDTVISTIPLPYLPKLVPSLSTQIKTQINQIKNVGVVCLLFKLKNPFSPYFWMNINDKRIELPGIIEYTNLNPGLASAAPAQKESIVYVPYYMPQDHPKNTWSNEQFIAESLGYLQKIKPEFDPKDVLATHVARYGFAQTVCSPNFYEKLPPIKCEEIDGFFMADTAYYYPEDRSISESVDLGKKISAML